MTNHFKLGLRVAAVASVYLWTSAQPNQLTVNEKPIALKGIQFAMTSSRPGAGVAFRDNDKNTNLSRVCFNRECLKVSHQWQLLATDTDEESHPSVLVEDKAGRWTFKKLSLNVDKKDAAKQETIAKLRVPASIMHEINEQTAQIEKDNLRDQNIFAHSEDVAWSTHWALPLKHITVVSEFGSFRSPPNGAPYAHTGVDLRAASGTKVMAISDGTVVEVGTEVIGGNVITIDHGQGVTSRYLHLSEFKVKVGEKVKGGDVVALSGATGRVEAPHLHWEMRVRGRPVDPLSTRRLLARLSDPE